MAGPRRYPLEAARTVRAVERDRAAEALARAARELERAEARRLRAAEKLAARRRGEVEAGGACTAAALQREERHRERRREEEAALRRALERALALEQLAAGEVRRAREALERAGVEREVIERHHERWAAGEARAAERAAEDER